MKKRKQHYVWKYYLKPWLIDGKLYCLRKKKIFFTEPSNILQETDFYRLSELNEIEIDFLRRLIDETFYETSGINATWIQMFMMIFSLKNNKDTRIAKDKLDIAINNLEEDLHGLIESLGIEMLDALRNGDSSFYKIESKMMEFNYFLSVQYMRTKKMKTRFIEKQDLLEKPPEYSTVRLDKVWNLASHLLATNLGYGLSSCDEFKCVFLENTSKIPFITGDQPIINIHADYNKNDNEWVEKSEFYYPITPTRAILITDSKKYLNNEKVKICESEVIKFNEMIFESSYETIVANCNDILEKFNFD